MCTIMDVTLLFKACVKTLRTRNKALGVVHDTDRTVILKPRQPPSDFNCRAREINSSISKMKNFLKEHRNAYINSTHLMYEASQMTDDERDQIDKEAQQFVFQCREIIKNLRKEVRNQSLTPQQLDHHEGIIMLLEAHLKSACRMFTEQKAIRVKRAYDKQKLSRLEPETKKKPPPQPAGGEQVSSNQTESSPVVTSPAGDVPDLFGLEDWNEEALPVSYEEFQMFEQENKKLYEDLNSLSDEVKNIEGHVMEISQLQKVFTEKVLEQDEEMVRVANTLGRATENVKDGNEELRQAMKNNAGFRISLLFFLLVLSFSLLFLDWYNP
ncbi:syntaxin-18-like [Ornithodoros turicata]|uniref:syntaxin-18-like n=1 Tax=Ornithodoros turicata TaxID=34597 RepID=UPI00313981E6